MSFISDQLQQLAQQNFLQRQFYQALLPTVMFLAAADLEEFGPAQGSTVIRTVAGRKDPVLEETTPSTEPVPQPTSYEWFRTVVKQYTGTDDVPMNQAYGTIPGYFLQKMVELGQQCGTSLNLQVRNALYKAYLAGNTVTYDSDGGAPTTTIPLVSGNGFREHIINGDPVPISTSAPKTVTIGTNTRSATGWAPLDAAQPDGPGILTVSVAVAFNAATRVIASDRSLILRQNNATTVDGIAANDAATLALFRRAVAQLTNDGVRPMADGYFHIHCSPFVIQELGSDNEYQRLFQSRPELYLKDGSIGVIGNMKFFDNNQTPQPGRFNSPNPIAIPTRATELDKYYCGELYNASGVQIERSIVVGRGAVTQLYVPELPAFISEGGIIGKQMSGWAMVGDQLQMVMGPGTGQVRVIIRPPIDRTGQITSLTWSATRGYPVYANLLSGQSNGRFKKAMVVETGHEPIA